MPKKRSELFDYYRVSWLGPNDGQKHYGVVTTFGPEASNEWKKGLLIVNDAILPKSYLIPIVNATKMKFGEFGKNEYDLYVNRELEKAQQLSDALGEGLKVGKLFGTGVGDGTAWYVVTKVTQKTVTVEWRGFCLDRYTDQILSWGGSFPRRAIEPQVGFADGMKKIFSKKKAMKVGKET